MLDLLKGVKVLDLTSIILGPMAGQILGDLGADVIKVEPPTGDLARLVAPHGPDGTGSMYVNNNRNKRSVVLDLKSDDGRAVFHKLVERSDVLVHNMRIEPLRRLGFDAAACRAINPALIHCGAVGFGSSGPYAGRPAYDDVIQAASGLAGLPVLVGGEPGYVPSVVTDKIAALHVVYAVAAALFRRERTGEGCTIEVPMFELMAAFILDEHLGAATFSKDAKPGYSRLTSPYRRPFKTADGWVAVLPYDGRHWRRVLSEIGREDVSAEPWFASDRERLARTGDLYQVLAEAMPERRTEEWLEAFARLDVPHSRVAELDDLVADPHLAAVGFFNPTDDAPGRVRSIAQPLTFEDAPKSSDIAPPALGADTRSVLAEIGYKEAEIERLVSSGAIAGREEAS